MKHNFSLFNSCYALFILSIFCEYTAYCSSYMWKILSQHDGRFLLACLCHRHGRKKHHILSPPSSRFICSPLHSVALTNPTRSQLRQLSYCYHQPCYKYSSEQNARSVMERYESIIDNNAQELEVDFAAVGALTQFMQECSYVRSILRSLYALIHPLHMPFLQRTATCFNHNLLYFVAGSSRFHGLEQFFSQLLIYVAHRGLL